MLTMLVALTTAHAEAPAVPECSVLVPVYSIDGKNPSMGAMFGLTDGDRTLLVTANHLFGPSGGQDTQLTGPKVAESVKSVVVRDAFTGAECGRSAKAIAVADAKPMEAGNNAGDLALFELTVDRTVNRIATAGDRTVSARDLAERAPKKGDAVYVIAKVPEHDQKAWKAEVVEVADGAIYYLFDNKAFAGTSGSAVVTEGGKTVGMHLGGGPMDDGSLVGTALPWTALKAHVDSAE